MDWLNPAKGKGALKALPYGFGDLAIQSTKNGYANLEMQAEQKWAVVKVWVCRKVCLQIGLICKIQGHFHLKTMRVRVETVPVVLPLSFPQWPGLRTLCVSESHLVLSDSLRPHGLYSLWNSPGQNTGVGSLSLLQGIFPTQGSNPDLPHCRQILCQLSHITLCDGFLIVPLHSCCMSSSQDYQSRLPFPTSGDLSQPGIEPESLASPALAGRFFTTASPGKPTSQILRGLLLDRLERRIQICRWETKSHQ